MQPNWFKQSDYKNITDKVQMTKKGTTHSIHVLLLLLLIIII